MLKFYSKIKTLFLLTILFLLAFSVKLFAQEIIFQDQNTQQKETVIILTGIAAGKNGGFSIITKAETQSRTSYHINKKQSNKKAFKKLKNLSGKTVSAECKLLEMKNPFSYEVALLSINELN